MARIDGMPVVVSLPATLAMGSLLIHHCGLTGGEHHQHNPGTEQIVAKIGCGYEMDAAILFLEEQKADANGLIA